MRAATALNPLRGGYAWSCVVSKWYAGAAILLGVGERDERRSAFQDAVVVALFQWRIRECTLHPDGVWRL